MTGWGLGRLGQLEQDLSRSMTIIPDPIVHDVQAYDFTGTAGAGRIPLYLQG